MLEAEVAIVGGGAAGLSLARMLAQTPCGGTGAVLLFDTPERHLRPPERTWCFWDRAKGDLDAFTAASWPRVRVHGASGRVLESAIAPMRYHMVRSADYERAVGRLLAGAGGVRRIAATVTGVEDDARGALLRCATPEGRSEEVRVRWVFDSRPLRPLPRARTLLLQHFRGWFVRTAEARFTPDAAVLMDLRTPQPSHGLSFGYVLPFDTHTALLEYTEFSSRPLDVPGYEAALRHYAGEVLRLGRYTVESTEQGVIPMTDARLPQRVGRSVFRIGAAGGATRPATGYTFAAAQRQVRAVAAALRAGRTPVPPPAHSARARAMDAVLLRALDTGRVDGAAFFERLFARNPAGDVLRFLDGRTSALEDVRIGASAPVLPMLRTAAELPFLRQKPPDGG